MQFDFDIEVELLLEALEAEARYRAAKLHDIMSKIMRGMTPQRSVLKPRDRD